VIIVAGVLIVVGVAFGMYLKMKANREKKSISLLTEGEEIDEEV
jgi:hypothetical protein